jgi:hypothetical protein
MPHIISIKRHDGLMKLWGRFGDDVMEELEKKILWI